MSAQAKAVYTLYRMGRIDKAGVRKAVFDNLISEAEYEQITGEKFEN